MSDIDVHAVYHDLYNSLKALAEHFEKEKDGRLNKVDLMLYEIILMSREDGIDATTESTYDHKKAVYIEGAKAQLAALPTDSEPEDYAHELLKYCNEKLQAELEERELTWQESQYMGELNDRYDNLRHLLKLYE